MHTTPYTFTKLYTGDWGVKGPDLTPGKCVIVQTRAGRRVTKTVGRVVWTAPDGTAIAEIAADAPAPTTTPAPTTPEPLPPVQVMAPAPALPPVTSAWASWAPRDTTPTMTRPKVVAMVAANATPPAGVRVALTDLAHAVAVVPPKAPKTRRTRAPRAPKATPASTPAPIGGLGLCAACGGPLHAHGPTGYRVIGTKGAFVCGACKA